MAVVSLVALSSSVSEAAFDYGDVFAAVEVVKLCITLPMGTLKDTYNVCGSEYVTGMAFDSDGKASFTYTGSGARTDTIVAKYMENGKVYQAEASKKWITTSIPEFSPIAVGIFGILGMLVLSKRK